MSKRSQIPDRSLGATGGWVSRVRDEARGRSGGVSRGGDKTRGRGQSNTEMRSEVEGNQVVSERSQTPDSIRGFTDGMTFARPRFGTVV